ncbi:MAG: cysteine desulfurase-like protein [Phototrophicales bacterium]
MTLNPNQIRTQFPALTHHLNTIFFDNPAGTQVPQGVIDAYSTYFSRMNANAGGFFQTSRATDEMTDDVRQEMAYFLNANTPNEIVFGANMTTLNFALSRALAQQLQPGDEVVLTRMDHDANVAPWLRIAQDHKLTVRWVDIIEADCTLDLDSLEAALTDRTKIVATVHASNAVGTINPVAQIAQMAHAANALYVVDAVQSAPHIPLDVQAIGCDFLLCSAYKFFGPHVGVMWGKHDLLQTLMPYKVRPAKDQPPYSWETGTPNFEGIAALGAALMYLKAIGAQQRDPYQQRFPSFSGDALDYKCAMEAIRVYEQGLVTELIDVLQAIPGVRIYGITDPARYDDRCPTVVFTHATHSAATIAQYLAKKHIYVWSGDYYAVEIMRRLGHADDGMVRVGLAHYNTHEEIQRFATILRELLA